MAGKQKVGKRAPQAARKVTTTTNDAADADAIAGTQADYDMFIHDALALGDKEVVPYRADASLAYHNVIIGLKSLLAREAEAKKLPDTNLERVKQLPSQCLAVAFAAGRVNDRPSGELRPKLARAAVLRRSLLRAADSLADAGLFRAKDVAAIHANTGKIDMANDCVALAALFTKNAAAIKGKTAITAAEVKEAGALGRDLLAVLKPSTAKRTRSAEAASEANARDRLWTLVTQGYDQLWRACAYLYGRDAIDTHVPALQAHVATTSARKKANAAKKEAAKKPAAAAPA